MHACIIYIYVDIDVDIAIAIYIYIDIDIDIDIDLNTGAYTYPEHLNPMGALRAASMASARSRSVIGCVWK